MTDKQETMELTRLVRIYPNSSMRRFIKRNIRYSQECWNRGIRTWQHMYHKQPQHLNKVVFTPKKDKQGVKVETKRFYQTHTVIRTTVKRNRQKQIISYKFTPVTRKYTPSGRSVRDNIIDANRAKGLEDTVYPNEVFQNILINDLDQSYQAFFDPKRPDSKRPKIKQKISDNGSYLDTQAHIKDGKIFPTTNVKMPNRKLYTGGIRCGEDLSDLNDKNKRYRMRFIHRDHKFYVAISVERPIKSLMATGQWDGVDVNVDHFNSTNKVVWLSKQPLYDRKLGKAVYQKTRLARLYDKIAHYQRTLANKRECIIRHAKKAKQKIDKSLWQTKNYQKIQLKLRQCYLKVDHIQHDIVQKYTNYLVKYHDRIYIEDLDVKHMKMGVASKGLHRSLFGYFRQTLTYKCQLFGRELVVVHAKYPSTQVCPNCGFAKAGDNKITLSGNQKHHTKHNEFKCYHCGYIADRDAKVPASLIRYSADSMSEIMKRQKLGQDYQVLGI